MKRQERNIKAWTPPWLTKENRGDRETFESFAKYEETPEYQEWEDSVLREQQKVERNLEDLLFKSQDLEIFLRSAEERTAKEKSSTEDDFVSRVQNKANQIQNPEIKKFLENLRGGVLDVDRLIEEKLNKDPEYTKMKKAYEEGTKGMNPTLRLAQTHQNSHLVTLYYSLQEKRQTLLKEDPELQAKKKEVQFSEFLRNLQEAHDPQVDIAKARPYMMGALDEKIADTIIEGLVNNDPDVRQIIRGMRVDDDEDVQQEIEEDEDFFDENEVDPNERLKELRKDPDLEEEDTPDGETLLDEDDKI